MIIKEEVSDLQRGLAYVTNSWRNPTRCNSMQIFIYR